MSYFLRVTDCIIRPFPFPVVKEIRATEVKPIDKLWGWHKVTGSVPGSRSVTFLECYTCKIITRLL